MDPPIPKSAIDNVLLTVELIVYAPKKKIKIERVVIVGYLSFDLIMAHNPKKKKKKKKKRICSHLFRPFPRLSPRI